jgi:chaperonin GroES
MKLNKILENKNNIAKVLSKEQLASIGSEAYRGYMADLLSRVEWEHKIDMAFKLALQVTEKKNFPWENASNVKYPLISTAAMQFAARAYPTLVPSDGKLVKMRVIGYDPQGEKLNRAERISKHMSYQILEEMDNWDEDMDKLLIALPIVGFMFKKTYYDSAKQKNCSYLVYPKNLVINYWAKSVEDTERKTEIIYLSKRKIKEKQLEGIFLDVDLGDPVTDNKKTTSPQTQENFTIPSEGDFTTPYTILEQHSYLDLDEDGYAEPYTITFEEATQKILRIVPCFYPEDIEVNEKGDIVKIPPHEYYTKFSFVPNPDGSFYDLGFGHLLGPINESVNTLINQLVDAGSLSNLQSGFLGKGLRIKLGDAKFKPGEWKTVNVTGDDIKKQVFALPVRDPSEVLMSLVQLLIQSGKEFASISEMFVGKMPGQNTPATTTMATIEQGMKVFTAIYKRVYRALSKEFRKIYKLNKIYLDPYAESDVLDMQITQSDYISGSENDIAPAADPQAISMQEKLNKYQSILQLLQLGTINPMEVTKRILEAQEISSIEQLIMQPQPPQPDPKVQEAQAKLQFEGQKAQIKNQEMQNKMQMQQKLNDATIKQKNLESYMKLRTQLQDHQAKMGMKQQESAVNRQSSMMDLEDKAITHAMTQKQMQEKHTAMLKQQSKVSKKEKSK